jgi:hypothetical protein
VLRKTGLGTIEVKLSEKLGDEDFLVIPRGLPVAAQYAMILNPSVKSQLALRQSLSMVVLERDTFSRAKSLSNWVEDELLLG